MMMNSNINRATVPVRPRILLSIAALLAAITSPVAYGAIALDRTRVIFDGSEKSVSLNISNQNQHLPYLAQGWIEDAQGNKIQGPLTVLPPVQRIEPGKPSQIKIQALPNISTLPQDRETVYYFNLREIPPKSSKANTLQIALQTRIKLFYRPKAVAIERNAPAPQAQLTLIRQGDQYLVNNPTPYYVTFVNAGSSKQLTVKDFEPLMVAPKSQMALTTSATSIGNSPVLTYVNDYGGRPQLSFTCSGSTCNVVAEKRSN